jgi:hypothetical protein
MISTEMTAAVGPESYGNLGENDEALQALFARNPIGALRRAAVQRVRAEVEAAGGVHGLEVCATPNADDWKAIESVDAVRFSLRMRSSTRELRLGWEQGRWKIDGFELHAAAPEPAPAKPKKGSPRR